MRNSIRMIVAVLATTALVGAIPGAAQAAPGPKATAAAKQCGNVTTKNGGKATFVTTVNAKCGLGKKVARRARGRRYKAFGFTCKPRKSNGLGGKLFGCGRAKGGKGQGIGFIYKRP